MKKVLLILLIPILIGLSNVSAEDSQSGSVNTAPIAVDDMINTNEDVPVDVFVTLNDTDTGTGILMVTGLSNVLNGTGVINGSGTGVIFTPNQNFNGTGSFIYTVSDGLLTDTGSVIISINPVNDKPVAFNDSVTMTKNTSVSINLVANDSDVDGDSFKVISLGNVLNGTGVINLAGTGVVFTPNQNFIGTISFSYTISDLLLTDVGNVTINVVEGNISPVAVDDSFITKQNTSKTIDPRVNDSDTNGDVLTITGVTIPLHGTTTFTNISVTYIPNNNYYGTDTFNYTVVDGKGGSDIGTVNVEVKKDNSESNDDDKHKVKNLQKEYIREFKEIKKQYKGKEFKKEYLALKRELRSEYLLKLKDITGENNKEKKSEKYKYEGKTSVNNYINIYANRYGDKLSALDDEGLNILLGKIDNLITKINTGDYSDTAKARYNTMLLALRNLVIEKLENSDDVLNLDSLFE